MVTVLDPRIVSCLHLLLSDPRYDFQSRAKSPNVLVLSVPVCHLSVDWHVRFNRLNPLAAPPDIIFPAGDEDCAGDPGLIGSVLAWCDQPEDKGIAMLNFVLEMRQRYLTAQLGRLARLPSEKLHFDYQTLLKDLDGVEVLLRWAGGRPPDLSLKQHSAVEVAAAAAAGQPQTVTAHCLIPLQLNGVDSEAVLADCGAVVDRSGFDDCKFLVSYRIDLHSADSIRYVLTAAGHVRHEHHGGHEQAMAPLSASHLVDGSGSGGEGGSSSSGSWGFSSGGLPKVKIFVPLECTSIPQSFSVPQWTDGTCLAEFAANLQQLTLEKVRETAASLALRHALLRQLILALGPPLEYDAATCTRIAWLFTDFKCPVVVHVIISPSTFPNDLPLLWVCSAAANHSCTVGGVPHYREARLTSYPWSPRWAPDRMASTIRDHLADQVQVLKRQWEQQGPPGAQTY